MIVILSEVLIYKKSGKNFLKVSDFYKQTSEKCSFLQETGTGNRPEKIGNKTGIPEN